MAENSIPNTSESSPPVIPSYSIDYSQKALKHGTLQYQQVFSNQYGSPININTGNTITVFNLPTEVFNLSESILMYTVQLPAPTTGHYIWTYEDTIGEIQHIQFYGSNNQFICDIDNFQNYYKVVVKRETGQKEFLTNDALNGVYPSNSLNNVVPALRSANGRASATPVISAANPSDQNYREPAYFSVGALNSAVSYQVQLPFKEIHNTILSMDKNLYFGGITYIKIFWGPISKVCYMSTSNANPSAGSPVAYASATTSPLISNLQLMLAIESNPDERASVINMVNSGGLSMMIPYAQSYKNPNNNSSQNINLQLDAGSGRTMLKMYHSVFANNEDLDTAYDCSNVGVPTITIPPTEPLVPQKVLQYYTQLNNKRVQNITIDCTVDGFFTDYMQQKNSLVGSILENRNVYQYNWHHMDDWSDFTPDYVQSGNSELLSGVALGGVPITWTFVGSKMTPANYNHYSYGIFTKKLLITPNNILVN